MEENEPFHSLLSNVRKRYTQQEIATYLQVTTRTVKRWEARESDPPPYTSRVLKQMILPLDNNSPNNSEFDFIDLFAGIGGIRTGFEEIGGRCVFTSEWDKYSEKTYRTNFSNSHQFAGDITKVKAEDIPTHDVLLAGFPCQPFSIAGISKKKSLGRSHGFACEAQGTLFFDVARILKYHTPAAFLLENVKNLKGHDKGRTFEVIMRTLQDELGYSVQAKVIDGKGFVPQHRERVYIVGFRDQTSFSWDDLKLPASDEKKMIDILHPEDGSEEPEGEYTIGKKAKVNEKYILSNKLWKYLQDYAAKHKAKGNGFGYGLVTGNDTARTLSARYYKDGSEILVSRSKGNPRRLTPRECSRLMGFDNDDRKLRIPVSDTQAYRQFGNSVVVPVISEIARIMKPHLMEIKEAEGSQGFRRAAQ